MSIRRLLVLYYGVSLAFCAISAAAFFAQGMAVCGVLNSAAAALFAAGLVYAVREAES